METEFKGTKPQFTVIDYPNFSVTLCSSGASVYSIKVNDVEMLSTFQDKEVWLEDRSYHGKTIGRVAGRIKNAAIGVGGKTYNLEANERTTSLHGGFVGLSFRNFDVVENRNKDYSEVIYSYRSPDMECGFPGDVDFEIIYRVYPNKSLEIIHKAKSNALTPISLTQHLYYALGEKTLENTYMQVKAEKHYLLDDDLIKLNLVDVKDTSYDFRQKKLVMKDAFNKDVKGPNKNGFDDIWYLGTTSKNSCCAVLETPKYLAEFYTDYDAAVIYMNGYPSHQMLTTGITEEFHSAITMELTNGDIQFVDADKPYNKYTKIQFKEKI